MERTGLYAQNMPLSQAARLASLEIEAPGCSEHQTPWAVDIRICDGWNQPPRQEPLEESIEGRYLLETCWKYGFIRRYDAKNPPNRQEEQYHFRYVGRAHAAMMRALGLNLEDYLLILHEKKTLCLYEEGTPRILVTADRETSPFTIQAPFGATLDDVSCDNLGWAVAAYWMD